MKHEKEEQLNHLRFWFDLDYPFEEDSAIEQGDDRESVDTEELENPRYIADLKPIPSLVDLIKKWYGGWGEKLFPPMKPM
jgi:hypothetical protein